MQCFPSTDLDFSLGQVIGVIYPLVIKHGAKYDSHVHIFPQAAYRNTLPCIVEENYIRINPSWSRHKAFVSTAA